jgi:hypothetical protein
LRSRVTIAAAAARASVGLRAGTAASYGGTGFRYAAAMAEARASWTTGWRGAVLLSLLVVAAFARSLGGGFVWDDQRFIAENPAVVSPASWLAFFTDPTTADTFGARGILRPMRTLEFALDHALFGLSPAAFRIHSLLWHLAASVALLSVLRRLLPDPRAALVAAVFWAVHPVQAESVAFVSSRGDVAMGALCLVSILFAMRSQGFDRDLAVSLRSPPRRSRRSTRRPPSHCPSRSSRSDGRSSPACRGGRTSGSRRSTSRIARRCRRETAATGPASCSAGAPPGRSRR